MANEKWLCINESVFKLAQNIQYHTNNLFERFLSSAPLCPDCQQNLPGSKQPKLDTTSLIKSLLETSASTLTLSLPNK